MEVLMGQNRSATFAKRARERARQEKRTAKAAKRAQRRADKPDRLRLPGEDPDLAGITPGPQSIEDADADGTEPEDDDGDEEEDTE
jgi:hypothetical protein